jgi:hypothetical protein
MARLEDLVTPTELLDAIKSGSMKQDLMKEYKASEEDLALMLQPLYRGGRLSKDDFNNFFKGIAIASANPPDDDAPEEPEKPVAETHDVPTEMLHVASLQEPLTAVQTEATAIPEEDPQPELDLAPTESPDPEPEPLPVREEPEMAADTDEDAKEFASPGSAGVTALLDLIYSRLIAIDERLAKIERNLETKG